MTGVRKIMRREKQRVLREMEREVMDDIDFRAERNTRIFEAFDDYDDHDDYDFDYYDYEDYGYAEDVCEDDDHRDWDDWDDDWDDYDDTPRVTPGTYIRHRESKKLYIVTEDYRTVSLLNGEYGPHPHFGFDKA